MVMESSNSAIHGGSQVGHSLWSRVKQVLGFFSTFDHCQKSENDFLFPHISVPLWSLMVTLKELFGSDPFPHIAVAEDRSFPPTRVCKLSQMAGHVIGQ